MINAIVVMLSLLTANAYGQTVSGTEFSLTAQGSSVTKRMDVSSFAEFSFQVEYASASLPSINVSDGGYSSATITSVNYDALRGRPSSTTITLISGQHIPANIEGKYVAINGNRYTEGVDWFVGYTSTATMLSLRNAITQNLEYYANVSSNVVTVFARSSGTYANGWTTTTDSIAIGTTTWGNGQAFGYITIAFTTLTEGTDFNAITSNATTANNIEEAINANSALSSVVVATNSASGIVLVRSIETGIHPYGVSVSSTAYLRVSYPTLTNGTTSDIDVDEETFTEVNHGYGTGVRLLFTRVSGSVPTGLVSGTTYFAIPVTANTFKLSATSTGAVAGSAVAITSNTGSGSFTLVPLAFTAGSAGFDWRGSNDGVSYYLLNTSSVTYTSHSGGLWSFVDYAYKYLMFNYLGPSAGGITINATFNGRKR